MHHVKPFAALATLLWAGFASAQEPPAANPSTAAPTATEAPATAAPEASTAPTTTTPTATQTPAPGTVAMPAAVSAGPVERPSRGQSMESVKAKFGAPSQEVAAVGLPPISRWEYPGYVVFFENDKVLHTVLMR